MIRDESLSKGFYEHPGEVEFRESRLSERTACMHVYLQMCIFLQLFLLLFSARELNKSSKRMQGLNLKVCSGLSHSTAVLSL